MLSKLLKLYTVAVPASEIVERVNSVTLLVFVLVHIKFCLNVLFIIIIIHLPPALLIFCMSQSSLYQESDLPSLLFSLQMAGQRNFPGQFLS